jgi:hypothetical protein
MIDASCVKVHPDASGAVGGNQDMDRTKGGSIPRYIWPWMRLVCRFEPLSQRVPERIRALLVGSGYFADTSDRSLQPIPPGDRRKARRRTVCYVVLPYAGVVVKHSHITPYGRVNCHVRQF